MAVKRRPEGYAWEIIEKLRNLLYKRQHAYLQVFNPDHVYRDTVLKDLAKFCRANDSTFHVDPRAHAMLEGRREVFLRIQRYLQLTPDEVWSYHNKGESDNG